MQIIQHVVELRWSSKSMIGHRVSHMSITDKLFEARIKRATLLVPYVFFLVYLMFHRAEVDEYVGAKHRWCKTKLATVVVATRPPMFSRVRLAILLLPPRARGLLGAPLRSVPPGRTVLADWAVLVELRRFSGNGRCHWI